MFVQHDNLMDATKIDGSTFCRWKIFLVPIRGYLARSLIGRVRHDEVGVRGVPPRDRPPVRAGLPRGGPRVDRGLIGKTAHKSERSRPGLGDTLCSTGTT